MTYPDQLRMDHVSEALWKTGGGASVMVGSGFSRNARPKRPNGSPMPMLEDIAAQLHRELYPDDLGHRPPAERLAQEYEVECGETKLHQVLRSMIADLDHRPGPFHGRLLRMPWRDAFTTNWDTLLERACEKAPERPYTVVRARSDLPWSSRPRIVKLHGSLPDPPLVLTEESYRRYPRTHAPFVNTVQQAMMETVVLLLGFSGDDPNFLHWSGWVRDNLRNAAPKIYLAGYLDLSRPRRKMLEEVRNVVPIDLAEHPRACEWPNHLRHQLATDWILSSLECAKPYDQTRWPKPPPKRNEIDVRIEPVVMRPREAPIAEPNTNPPDTASIEADIGEVAKLVDTWRHNRKRYPGWIVFPQDKRSTLRRTVENWTPFLLHVLPNIDWWGRLDVIYEVVWRFEKSLARIPEPLETAADEVLNAIDCEARAVGGESVSTVDWTAIRAKWCDVALSLLTAARYRLDADGFAARLGRLGNYAEDDPDVAQRIDHERCLWSLWSLDYKSLEERLETWDASGADPMWKVRKSALMREIGRVREADTLVEEAIAEVRAASPSGRDIATTSREGWALWSTISLDNFERIRARWRQLAPMKCDSVDVWDLRNALEHGDKDQQPTPGFDLGVQRTVHRWFRSDSERYAVTYGSVRLSEVAGLPTSVEPMDVAGSLLQLSAVRLVAVDPRLSIPLVLRAAQIDTDRSLQQVLSREHVAAMPKEEARRLASATQRAALHTLSRIEKKGQRDRAWANRARVTMEGWSRLTLRADDEVVNETFDRALDLYRSPAVASDIWLQRPLKNLLTRAWMTMPQRHRVRRVLEILETPIPKDGEKGVVSRYPEPGKLLSDLEQPPRRTPENESRWTSVVETLVQALSEDGIAREQASRRLWTIADWGLLTERESVGAAASWWGEPEDDDTLLPAGTTLPDYAFILMPEPRRGMGRRAFGRKWLSGDASLIQLTSLYNNKGSVGFHLTHENPQKADDILYQAGSAMAFLRKRGRSLALSSSERAFVTDVMKRWTETQLHWPRDIPDLFLAPHRQSLELATHGLAWLLRDLSVPAALAKALNRKVKELHDAQLGDKAIPAFAMLPGILRSAPEMLDDIDLTMKKGLASDDTRMASSALSGLRFWLAWQTDEALPPPLEHWVREVGVAIAIRRQATGAALDVAKWVFEKGRTDHRELIRDLVLTGMGYLLEELRYDRELADGDTLDVPWMRWRCIQLARAIAYEQRETPKVVERWLELAKEDPLPEVRHIASDWWSDGRGAE